MDLKARKYQFIEEFINIEEEGIIEALELVLKQGKEGLGISDQNRLELDKRLKSYKDNPEDLLDWETLKRKW